MAAVAGHSGFRGDPWGRLQRTSTFLAVTTYGTAADAQRAVDHVRGIHERIRGTTAEGVPYHAADPHLLGWVHAAETDSFLRAHERFGARPLDAAAYDAYVADTARVAEALGVSDPPRDRRELSERLIAYRHELGAALPRPGPPPASCCSGLPCPLRHGPSTAGWLRTPSCSFRPGPCHAVAAPGAGRRGPRRTPDRTGPDPDHPLGHDPTAPVQPGVTCAAGGTWPTAPSPRTRRPPPGPASCSGRAAFCTAHGIDRTEQVLSGPEGRRPDHAEQFAEWEETLGRTGQWRVGR
ncbi:hypothetical protein SALBM311S_12077 [Streptomyces alboniger]